MTVAFEINDEGILAATSQGGLRDWSSPGVARLSDAGLLLGIEAAAGERLRPTHTDQHFWTRLRSQTLSSPFPRDWSSADLAHAHLEDLRKRIDEPVWHDTLLAIPGSLPAEDLPLLLGIAKAAGLEVTGLVDSAVAAVASRSAGQTAPTVVHLELEQHRAVLTQLHCDDGCRRGDVEILEDCGSLSLRHRAAKHLADLFVRQTRFDPLHSAESEQQLYSALPGWLGELDLRGTAELTLRTARGEHRIKIGRSELVDVVAPIYTLLAGRLKTSLGRLGGGDIVLSHRADRIPDLRRHLREATGADVHLLDRGAAVLGALQEADQIRATPEGVRRVIQLNRSVATSSPPISEPRPGVEVAPTHGVIAGIAHPLSPFPVALGLEPSAGIHSILLPGHCKGLLPHHCTLHQDNGRLTVVDHSDGAIKVTNHSLENSPSLRVGDVLQLGQELSVQLIAVDQPHGET